MKPLSLSIQGFRSFQDEQTITFDQGPGLYLLAGKNQLEPSLGANGAGKSSVWDALSWVLFGKTARGVRGASVENWEGDHSTTVELRFERLNAEYTVSRTRRPNTLAITKDGHPTTATQEDVEALVGLSYATFLSTVLMGQFGRYFLDLTPAEKLALFGDVLDLSHWDAAAARARAEAKDADQVVARLELSIAKMTGTLASTKQRATELRELVRDAKAQQKQRKGELLELIRKHKAQSVHWRQLLDQASDVLQKRTEELAKVEGNLQTQNQHDSRIVGLVAKYGEALRGIENDLKGYDTRREEVKNLRAKCPTCGQRVDEASIADVLEDIDMLEGVTQVDRSRAGLQLKHTEEDLGRVRETIAALKQERQRLEVQNRAALALESQRLANVNNEQRRLKELRAELEDVEDVTAAPRKSLAKALEEASELAFQLNEAQDQLGKERLALDAYLFWSKRFRDIRLWVVERAIVELEVSVNNALTDLGLVGWSVRFDVERENASGGVTKGFTTMITSPHSPEEVPWEGWSGGETQRLRLAGAAGLSSLIADRQGASIGVEAWDEPTAHLSGEGIEDLLGYFQRRAQATGKQVWLVDHRSLNSGHFNAEWLVTKTTDHGSRITQP